MFSSPTELVNRLYVQGLIHERRMQACLPIPPSSLIYYLSMEPVLAAIMT